MKIHLLKGGYFETHDIRVHSTFIYALDKKSAATALIPMTSISYVDMKEKDSK